MTTTTMDMEAGSQQATTAARSGLPARMVLFGLCGLALAGALTAVMSSAPLFDVGNLVLSGNRGVATLLLFVGALTFAASYIVGGKGTLMLDQTAPSVIVGVTGLYALTAIALVGSLVVLVSPTPLFDAGNLVLSGNRGIATLLLLVGTVIFGAGMLQPTPAQAKL